MKVPVYNYKGIFIQCLTQRLLTLFLPQNDTDYSTFNAPKLVQGDSKTYIQKWYIVNSK